MVALRYSGDLGPAKKSCIFVIFQGGWGGQDPLSLILDPHMFASVCFYLLREFSHIVAPIFYAHNFEKKNGGILLLACSSILSIGHAYLVSRLLQSGYSVRQ